jgi:dolichol-phosphate mannosyltransferase
MVAHRGTVILATYNDAESIPVVLAEVDEAASTLRRSGVELDVLLVDNSSVDDTVETALSIGASLGLKLAHITAESRDVGRAHLDGYRHALDDQSVEFLVTIDADGHHDARQICDVVRTFLARRSGMTVGSRWVRGGSSPGTSRIRATISRVANGLACRVSGVAKVHDSTTSFRAIRRDCAELLCERSRAFDSYGFFSASVAIAQAYGFVVDEVPIVFRPRLVGTTNLSLTDISTYAKGLLDVRAQVKAIRVEATSDQAAWAARNSSHRAQSTDIDSTFGALLVDRRSVRTSSRPTNPGGRRRSRHGGTDHRQATPEEFDPGDRTCSECLR